MTEKEELLKKHENTYVFNTLLDEYQDVYKLYETQQSCIWTPPEIDYSMDKKVYESMTPNEQHYYSHILAFFAGADGIVSQNISTRFIEDIDIPIIQATYAFQNYMEFIHNETYSLLLQSMIPTQDERDKLFNSIKTMPVIKKKYDYALKYMTCDCKFKYRLMAYILFEGIMFSGSFASIYYNKTKGGDKILQGLVTANEFIARDESMHVQFGILLYSKLEEKLTQKEIHNMFKKAVDIEKEFINESLPCNLIGMNAKSMSEYIEYLADFYLKWLGYDKLYNSTNPFPFMEAISLESKTNFFEHRVSQYSKAEKQHEFKIEDDF